MFFRTTYKRMNFGITPPLTQSADVLIQTDLSLTDHSDEIASLLYNELLRTHSSWTDYSPPPGLTTGWSSIMGGYEILEVSDTQMLALAWHCKKREWLCPDRVTTTIDPEEAGKFLPQEIEQLNVALTEPGSERPVLMSNLVTDIFGEKNEAISLTSLEVIFDEFVLWGYGPREKSVIHTERSTTKILSHVLPFSLPEGRPGGPLAQEYERIKSWAWRFNYGQGSPWRIAESQTAAQDAARTEAIEAMRENGYHNCHQFFAWKYNTKVKSFANESDT